MIYPNDEIFHNYQKVASEEFTVTWEIDFWKMVKTWV